VTDNMRPALPQPRVQEQRPKLLRRPAVLSSTCPRTVSRRRSVPLDAPRRSHTLRPPAGHLLLSFSAILLTDGCTVCAGLPLAVPEGMW
jgi:hypothetical protein